MRAVNEGTGIISTAKHDHSLLRVVGSSDARLVCFVKDGCVPGSRARPLADRLARLGLKVGTDAEVSTQAGFCQTGLVRTAIHEDFPKSPAGRYQDSSIRKRRIGWVPSAIFHLGANGPTGWIRVEYSDAGFPQTFPGTAFRSP